ncbi:MAG: hypothetical protein EBX68_01335 [Betaproteobacteria bacterium]|nr:hypothetical protein [Betaproteobacteria bacterium]
MVFSYLSTDEASIDQLDQKVNSYFPLAIWVKIMPFLSFVRLAVILILILFLVILESKNLGQIIDREIAEVFPE